MAEKPPHVLEALRRAYGRPVERPQADDRPPMVFTREQLDAAMRRAEAIGVDTHSEFLYEGEDDNEETRPMPTDFNQKRQDILANTAGAFKAMDQQVTTSALYPAGAPERCILSAVSFAVGYVRNASPQTPESRDNYVMMLFGVRNMLDKLELIRDLDYDAVMLMEVIVSRLGDVLRSDDETVLENHWQAIEGYLSRLRSKLDILFLKKQEQRHQEVIAEAHGHSAETMA